MSDSESMRLRLIQEISHSEITQLSASTGISSPGRRGYKNREIGRDQSESSERNRGESNAG